MDSTTLWIIIAVVAVVVITLLIAFFVSSRSRARRQEERRERTREEFGPEYERTAQERGSEEEAERELRRRRGRIEWQVEPLSDESRRRYEERWGEVERLFVDNPERSVEVADRTVSDLLEERNFISDPAQSDEETGRGLASMHPEVADDYREARRIRADVVGRSAGNGGDGGATEEMRQALKSYRSVYKRLAEG